MKHNAGKEVRFAIAEEEVAVYLFLNAAVRNKSHAGAMRIELVHCDHVLVSTYIENKSTTPSFYSMLKVMKSAI